MAVTPSPSLNTRSFLPRVCVAIVGNSVREMADRLGALLPKSHLFELRLDYLDIPQDAPAQLRSLVQAHSEATFLATARPERSGGRLRGSGADELAILLACARAGCHLVDLSLETAEELGPEALLQLRSHGTAVLLSFHNFDQAEDLLTVLTRMRPFPADFYKVVPTAQTMVDSLTLLQSLRSASLALPTPLVAMCMGEPGLLTRVLGPRFGSAFTFAAATDAEATAPGQLTAQTLLDLYRVGQLTPETSLYGVAGDPVRTSLSPLMQNTAFQHAALDAVYLPLMTSDPEVLFRAARELPLQGFSVTMPLKQTILPFLDEIDPLAARIGAVNTVVRYQDGTFQGFNTDAEGIVGPLEERLSLQGTRVLVLGAGGAARAAVFGCLDRGADVFLCNRSSAPALALATEAGASVLAPARLALEDFDVLINATPAGMRGNPQLLALREEELRAALVFDLVYNPIETPLLALARAQGRQVIPGVEMFVQQGARQFELWTGLPAPVNIMRSSVVEKLRSL